MYWGYDRFRPLQKEIISSVLEGKDTLALLPTGGGKSVCYQLPAMMTDGWCLVISPLIALMQDQVAQLRERDIPAACIYGGMPYSDLERTLQQAVRGAYRLLYVSPERLQSSLFREYLPEFDLSLIAVDEAHCISQWGHDFRPDYLKIASIRTFFPRTPVLALTATATTPVQEDITQQLALRTPLLFRQSFRRPNIFYDIRYSENKLNDCRSLQQQGSTIIYCRSRRQTEQVVRHLKGFGMNTVCYHAGMSRTAREEAQDQWMTGTASTIVATTAFGMGINKPDVRTVIHYDAPEHPEAWYQETGRAGRDGRPSLALTLYDSSDLKRLQESTALRFPGEAYLRQVYQSVCEYLQLPIGTEPDKYYPFQLADFCRKFDLKPLAASNALRLLEQEDLWTLTESVFRPATIFLKADRPVLDQLAAAYPLPALVLTHMLRLYGTLFYYPTPVRIPAIAKQARLPKDVILQALGQLHQMDLLEFRQPAEGEQLYFHHQRVDSRHLLIDLQRIGRLRREHEARTAAMVRLLEQKDICRERYVLEYFGEASTADCGHCDSCRGRKAPRRTPDSLRRGILGLLAAPRSLEELFSYFTEDGREPLVQVLRELMDEGVVGRDPEGSFIIHKLPTN